MRFAALLLPLLLSGIASASPLQLGASLCGGDGLMACSQKSAPQRQAFVLGNPLDTDSEVITIAGAPAAGDTVTLHIIRDGVFDVAKTHTVDAGNTPTAIATTLADAFRADETLLAHRVFVRSIGAAVHVDIHSATGLTFAGSATGATTVSFATNTATFTSALQKPNIDGGACQLGWAQMEKTEGVYTWPLLDACISAAMDASLATGQPRRATLHIMAAPNTASTPSWLKTTTALIECPSQTTAAGTDANGNTGTALARHIGPTADTRVVVPWDCVYRAKFKAFINAVAAHLTSNNRMATVFAVSQTAPVGEMTIIGCSNGKFYGGRSFQVNTSGPFVTYDRDAYLAAWKDIADTYAAAFPGKFVLFSAPFNQFICPPAQDAAFYTELADYLADAHPRRFMMFATDLGDSAAVGLGSIRMKAFQDMTDTIGLAFQPVCSASASPNCPPMGGVYPTNWRRAVCYGKAMGATYFEVYKADALDANAEIQAGTNAIHDESECPGVN